MVRVESPVPDVLRRAPRRPPALDVVDGRRPRRDDAQADDAAARALLAGRVELLLSSFLKHLRRGSGGNQNCKIVRGLGYFGSAEGFWKASGGLLEGFWHVAWGGSRPLRRGRRVRGPR